MPKLKASPSNLKQTLSKANVKKKEPLWEGPESDGPNGGVTQSLLSRFLCCRERFRVYAIEGLRPRDEWNHRTGYGDMWHLCEEAYAKGGNATTGHPRGMTDWQQSLLDYCQKLLMKYPMQQEQIRHWYSVCMVQFPIYVDYWAKHPDMLARTPLLQEQAFNVPYELPSGRIVRLRGKFDSVDLVGKGKDARVWLMENKSKGDIDASALQRQLTFDLQTMLYLVAMQIGVKVVVNGNVTSITSSGKWFGPEGNEIRQPKGAAIPIAGVRYNAIRRPLSGGKGTIVRHKPSKKNPKGETEEEYYNRLKGIIEEEPQHYFMRWMVDVTPADIERFKREFLNPALENLCDWYSYITSHTPFKHPDTNGVHFRLPYGIYNVIAEGGFSDVDEYLNSGNQTGLRRTDVLFKEL